MGRFSWFMERVCVYAVVVGVAACHKTACEVCIALQNSAVLSSVAYCGAHELGDGRAYGFIWRGQDDICCSLIITGVSHERSVNLSETLFVYP